MPENKEAVSTYTQEVFQTWLTGHAKEHGYRPALERLMSSFEDVVSVNDPKRSEFGNPDFVFLKRSNRNIILGYAETKDIGADLNKVVISEQLRRYAGYDNLFLTNYVDFRFFQNGEEYEQISIGQLINNQLLFDPNSYARLQNELSAFLELPPEKIKSGRRLATIMGGKARRIRDNVQSYLQREEDEKNQELEKIYEMMKSLLVHDLSKEKFADMYAQTLVYGLFVARYNDETPATFSRKEARDLVPASNPFLREFFDHIVGPHFDVRLAHIVDELCEVFSVSDVQNIVHKHLRLFDVKDEKDPIIHFYEDFLKEYDPAERKKMGAYYTPLPVVRFIIRTVDEILKRDFDLDGGLANTSRRTVTIERQGIKSKVDVHKVQILDPAVGTATFLNEIIKYIYRGFEGQEGRWPTYAESDLMPRLYGFELMMAPYTIAHLKLSMTLQETGIKKFNQRLGVYLTNTLEEGIKLQQDLFTFGLAEIVSHESGEAEKIKSEKPIMVIVGNPPYAVESSNKTNFAKDLVKSYKVEPGGLQKLQERNSKMINDDYVKFIAFAEQMIRKNGDGIIGMITNHGYIDNPTFRGMRWHLVNTFDSIYVLDLHGNTKKREVAPDGGKDENVFDIQQGVAIIFAVKTGKKKKGELAKVYGSDLFGLRTDKFSQLDEDPDWENINLDRRMFFFKNLNIEGQEIYERGIKLNELFINQSSGVSSSRDEFVVDVNKRELTNRIQTFFNRDFSDNEIKEKYHLSEAGGWSIHTARRSMNTFDTDKIISILYRPFDKRWTYWDKNLNSRMREQTMRHFLINKNVGLIFKRGFSEVNSAPIFIADSIIDRRSWSRPGMRGAEVIAPLYIDHEDGSRTPNFKPDVLKHLTAKLSKPYEPEDILDYIYAVLHSPKYRTAYQEFLKIDFPRVPAPANDDDFRQLAVLGRQLRELHLLNSPVVDKFITTYSVSGSNQIFEVRFDDNKVWINNTQYFGEVPKFAWDYYVGGYQPAQKWLKDRKGMFLNNDDIEHYQKIIKVLIETDRIMKEIDKVWGL